MDDEPGSEGGSAEAARPCRRAVGDRWFVDEADVKVAGQGRLIDRAADQVGQVIDVLVAQRRDAKAARRFFGQALRTTGVAPGVVTTDKAPVYPGVLKARLRPVRGRKQDRSTRVIIAGHAFVQNVRRGHCELAVDEPANRRLALAFGELALAI